MLGKSQTSFSFLKDYSLHPSFTFTFTNIIAEFIDLCITILLVQIRERERERIKVPNMTTTNRSVSISLSEQ